MNGLKKLQAAISSSAFDGLLLTSEVNRFYATGFSCSDGMALITANCACFLTDFRYIEAAQAKCPDYDITMVPRGTAYHKFISELLAKYDVKHLGFEEDRVSFADYSAMKKDLSPELIPASALITACRCVKADYELDCIKHAQSITEAAFDKLLGMIKPGVSERWLYAELIHLLYTCGASGLAFDPIVVSGPNSSLPHGVAGERIVQPGDFVTFDFAASYNGYCSDMTRTVAVGSATDEMRQIYDIVLEAQKIGLEKARADILWSDVDKAARDFIAANGHGNHFGHGLGHGLGVEIHEPGAVAGEVSPAGSVMTVEPGIYLPGKFGVRIEDMVVLKPAGNDNLTSSPKQLIIL